MTARHTHVVVIGAGPAGSAAAFGLARRGFRVTIIESRAFPRAKVCGEYISPAATEALESIVSARDLLARGARREGLFVLEVRGRTVEWRMPRAGWTLSRSALDDLLLTTAQDAGANVAQPVSVRSVAYADDGAQVSLADGRVIGASFVVHADGVGRFDPRGPVAHRAGVVGHKRHLRGAGIEGLRMRAAPGAYIGTVCVENGLATCAIVAQSSVVKRYSGDLDAMLEALWPPYRPAWAEGPWMSCPVPGAPYTEPGHPRSFRIGNAAAGVEPVGGEGIGLALWAGLTLADRLDPGDPVRTQRELAHAYRRRLRLRRPACRLAAATLMHPGFTRSLLPALRWPGATLAPWWALTGKPLAP